MTGAVSERHNRPMTEPPPGPSTSIVTTPALAASLACLVDAAAASPAPDHFLAVLGKRLLADTLPRAGGALTLAVPHPIIARRSWLWRAENGSVMEALGFTGMQHDKAGRDWLAGLAPAQPGTLHEAQIGAGADGPILGWA